MVYHNYSYMYEQSQVGDKWLDAFENFVTKSNQKPQLRLDRCVAVRVVGQSTLIATDREIST